MASAQENTVFQEKQVYLPGHQPWLFRFAMFVVVATILLILLGGEVKSREAGLSVPDWPTSFGYNMFLLPYAQWRYGDGGAFFEHSHRLLASVIGMLTIVLTLWVWMRDRRDWMKLLAGLTLVSVIIQGVLGGLTVKMSLPWWVSTAHGMLAQTFLLMLILLAYGASGERARRGSAGGEGRNKVVTAGLLLMAALYLQLFLGAAMRHTESGLAVPDFPTTAGAWVPQLNEDGLAWVNQWRQDHIAENQETLVAGDVTLGQMWLHFSHRIGAVLVLVAVFYVTKTAAQNRAALPKAFKTCHLLGALLLFQLLLGASVIWSARTPLITSFHVVTGALMLAVAFLLLLRAWPVGDATSADTDAA